MKNEDLKPNAGSLVTDPRVWHKQETILETINIQTTRVFFETMKNFITNYTTTYKNVTKLDVAFSSPCSPLERKSDQCNNRCEGRDVWEVDSVTSSFLKSFLEPRSSAPGPYSLHKSFVIRKVLSANHQLTFCIQLSIFLLSIFSAFFMFSIHPSAGLLSALYNLIFLFTYPLSVSIDKVQFSPLNCFFGHLLLLSTIRFSPLLLATFCFFFTACPRSLS